MASKRTQPAKQDAPTDPTLDRVLAMVGYHAEARDWVQHWQARHADAPHALAEAMAVLKDVIGQYQKHKATPRPNDHDDNMRAYYHRETALMIKHKSSVAIVIAILHCTGAQA